MTRFLISPGVITREVDNSQYAATVPAGNIAALVGYAEKGPFEPTLIRGPQEFNETFGKTLEDSPYLAQAAYKYFEQSDTLLVVRAGDNRDPAAYPQSAKAASKAVRVAPGTQTATAGSQSFTTTSPVAGGTYAPGGIYGFRVIADHRAFAQPMLVQTWSGVAAETANGLGAPVPATSISKTIVKVASLSPSSNSLRFNYKRVHDQGASTDEYDGTGTRTGTDFGNTVSATLNKYRSDVTYTDVPNDYIALNGAYGAATLGSVNLFTGAIFSGESFVVTVGSVTETITPNSDTYSTAAYVADAINVKLTEASVPAEAFVMVPSTGVAHIGLRKLGGSGTGMTLVSGTSDLLTLLGVSAKTYNDNETLFGTWNAATGVAGQTFSGYFIFKFGYSTSNAESFEDPINVEVTAPTGNNWELSDFVSQINAELLLAYDGTRTPGTDFWGLPLEYTYTAARGSASLVGGKITITAMDESGDQGESVVRLMSSSTGNNLVDLLQGVDHPTDGLTLSSVGEALITLRAAQKGTYGNNLIFRVDRETIQLTAISSEIRYNIYVLWNGKEVSIYRRLLEQDWTDPNSPNYIPVLLSNDPYIRVDAEDENGNLTMAVLPRGDWKLGSGELPDGVTASDAEIVSFVEGSNGWIVDSGGVIDSMSADFINALRKLYNSEVYDFNLVAAPGDSSPMVQNAVQDLCDSRRDCFGVIDAAGFGIGLGVANGTNHVSEVNDASSTLNSSYVGVYWPWLQDYDADNQQYVWLPPSIYALKQIVYTDNISDPWFAPAGTRRGKISAVDVEYSPSRTDRDILYGDTAIVNPIVKFVNEGIVIWGQKTAQRTRSALDRINVRRLLIYAEKLIARMARGFLFEPHDEANWAAFARQANAILEPIRQRRGLYTYRVICDSTTNTPALINQNIMAGKLFVQPTKIIEFIEVEFTINAAGEVEISE